MADLSSLLDAQRKQLSSSDVQRKSLEAEAEGIVSELTAELPDGVPPMGIDTPLVDAEGYPRADIDVYRARTLRNRLATIRTDHKMVMKRIEEGLAKVAALKNPNKEAEEKAELEARAAPKPKPKYDPVTGKWVVMSWDGSVAGVQGGDKRSFHNLNTDKTQQQQSNSVAQQSQAMQGLRIRQDSTAATATTEDLVPFALVKSVAPDSPACEAGLKEGDLILHFGSVDHTNHRDLQAIGALVPMAAGANETVAITVRRPQYETANWTIRKLSLRPRPWSGRGLLGCLVIKHTA